MNQYIKSRRIGFLGAGNMAQTMIRGLLETDFVVPEKILASNRTPGKLQKLSEQYGIRTTPNNEELVEQSDIVVLSVKPQDLLAALEPIARSFSQDQIVISLAAGVRMPVLEKLLPECRLVRLMPNTPSLIGRGVIGYLMNDDEDSALESTVEDLFSSLGQVLRMADEDQLEALMVACSSGTGFVFELMMYWQDWLMEHDFDQETARRMTVETFVGASLLASQSEQIPLEELQNRVASRKGVTTAGLQSMRELEIERALRISFEKAALRNSEIARDLK
ncbi:MAG: pyrroline-5-carboxylate reductase [Bdellovibrionaceae bacterium]|nr:pyrroline-5-carboxylate reductase [Pseudobdellovibrionaceae bacterium]MBX3032721.1 pyrroline-5-carboxylate reductase [Pseudobdellovibrionaceae bacterium]